MTQDEIKDRLRAAQALIDKPEKWTQCAMWRDSTGNSKDWPPEPNDMAARSATGAIREVCRLGEESEVKSRLLSFINRHMAIGQYCYTVTEWNDHPDRTHADVMQAFDRAIDDISKANN